MAPKCVRTLEPDSMIRYIKRLIKSGYKVGGMKAALAASLIKLSAAAEETVDKFEEELDDLLDSAMRDLSMGDGAFNALFETYIKGSTLRVDVATKYRGGKLDAELEVGVEGGLPMFAKKSITAAKRDIEGKVETRKRAKKVQDAIRQATVAREAAAKAKVIADAKNAQGKGAAETVSLEDPEYPLPGDGKDAGAEDAYLLQCATKCLHAWESIVKSSLTRFRSLAEIKSTPNNTFNPPLSAAGDAVSTTLGIMCSAELQPAPQLAVDELMNYVVLQSGDELNTDGRTTMSKRLRALFKGLKAHLVKNQHPVAVARDAEEKAEADALAEADRVAAQARLDELARMKAKALAAKRPVKWFTNEDIPEPILTAAQEEDL